MGWGKYTKMINEDARKDEEEEKLLAKKTRKSNREVYVEKVKNLR